MFLILTPLLKNTNKNRIVHSKNLVSLGIKPGNTKTAGSLDLSGFPQKNRAGDGNRTHVSSLEGWCSTIELHPHVYI